jgi:hypothetical protein
VLPCVLEVKLLGDRVPEVVIVDGLEQCVAELVKYACRVVASDDCIGVRTAPLLCQMLRPPVEGGAQ